MAKKRLRRIPKAGRAGVTRDEYNGLIEILNERGRILEAMQRALEIQFTRIAQIQAELDDLRAAWHKRMKAS